MQNGVVLQKLQAMDEALQELRSLGAVTPEQLRDDWRTRKAVERNLQILVEIVIDVCQRSIALAGQTPATSGGDAVERCVGLGVLKSVDPYQTMVRFRNFIVHHYERVDLDILMDILNHRLDDFEQFRDEVLRHGEA